MHESEALRSDMAYVIERDSRSGKRDISLADALEEIFDGPHPAVGGHAPCQVTSSVLSKTHVPTNMVGEPVGKVAVAGHTEPVITVATQRTTMTTDRPTPGSAELRAFWPSYTYAPPCMPIRIAAIVIQASRSYLGARTLINSPLGA